jgi:hypothetical protein
MKLLVLLIVGGVWPVKVPAEPSELQQAIKLIDTYDVRDFRGPMEPPFPKERWLLADDEIFAKVDGQWRTVKVEDDKNPLALLDLFIKKNPADPQASEALFQKASYYQMRRQFPQALACYEELVRRIGIRYQTEGSEIAVIPPAMRPAEAYEQIKVIKGSGVRLESTGFYPTGDQPKLEFTYRNARTVNFTAWKFDLAGALLAILRTEPDDFMAGDFGGLLFKQKIDWQSFRGEKAAEWQADLPEDKLMVVREASSLAPLAELGSYWIEAGVSGGNVSRTLLVISDLFLNGRHSGKIYSLGLADIRTGKAVTEAKITALERWRGDDRNIELVERAVPINSKGVGFIDFWQREDSQKMVLVESSLGFIYYNRWFDANPFVSQCYVFQPFGSFTWPDLAVYRQKIEK